MIWADGFAALYFQREAVAWQRASWCNDTGQDRPPWSDHERHAATIALAGPLCSFPPPALCRGVAPVWVDYGCAE